MHETAIIEVESLTKRYGSTTAVEGLNFSVKQGEVVGFVGLNGAGKSTTINMLLGFQRPSNGTVALFGENVTLANAHLSHREIGFATGDMSLFDGMTGKQYLAFVARTYGRDLESDAYRSLVQRFEPQLNKKLKTLSRGNRQKVALISAFMSEPKLIILDEPSSGLDPLMQQHFLDLVRDVSGKGTTIFMSSHYLNEVVDVCSRVLLIKQGRLVKDLLTNELERAAGKLVRVATKVEVTPPKMAELVERERRDNLYILQFVFRGTAADLQGWLSALNDLQDLTVSDDSALAAFEDLYEEEAV
jgi:ABC-2 type transport system ATP-binding protein